MNKHLNKLGILSFVIIILFAINSIVKSKGTNISLYKELINQQTKYKQLSDKTALLKINYISQKDLVKKLKTDWSKEKVVLKGKIKLLSNATYLIREKARKSNKSDLVYQGKKTKYIFNEIRFNNGPPVGYVMIFDNGKVVSKIYNHEIDVKLAVSREVSGYYHVVSKSNYILKSGHLKHDGVNWFGKPYPLNIVGGEVFIDPVENYKLTKSFMWKPQLNANINFNSNIIPGIGLSLAGYGSSKNDLDWKFLQIGTQNIKSNPGLTFTPILYRFNSKLFPNTYVGPGVNQDQYGTNYFLQFSVGF